MEIPESNAFSYLLPHFVLWFIFIYALGYFAIFKNWTKLHRAEASSCLISLFHGNVAFVSCLLAIFQSQNPKLNFTSANTSFQNTVLDYSIAYFSADLLHYLVFIPSDVLFIAHHVATLYVLATCRYLVGAGAVAILGVVVLAEATSACQNTWSLARYRKAESSNQAAGLFLRFLSPWFYAYYTAVRGVLGPLFAYKIGWFFASGLGDGLVPKWAWVSWIVVIVTGIGVSVLWILHLWIELYRERIGKKMGKSS